VLRRILRHEREESDRRAEKYGDQMEEDKRSVMCRRHETCNFSRKPEGKRKIGRLRHRWEKH
jgi:hypothetical protein